MNVRTWWAAGALVVILPCKAAGQICSGFAAFTDGRFQASGSGMFNDEARSLGAGFAFGTDWSFGQVNLGTTNYEGIDGSSFSASASAGYQFKLDNNGRIHMCPTVAAAYTSGPNDVDLFADGTVILDFTETDFTFGISLGVVATETDQGKIVPTASLGYVSATLKVEDQNGNSSSVQDSFGVLGLGIGFIISRVVTLHPGMSIPLGLEGSAPSFGATISINFGKPAQ